MTTEILYKYRSLEGGNFKFFVDIILNNRLYASSFKELNDPMEGAYYYSYQNEGLRKMLSELSDKKEKLRLCSLSKAEDSVLMWSHYANGHRGVVIGVSIDNPYNVKPVQYDGLARITSCNFNAQVTMEILSHKLEVWRYEQEERIFIFNSKDRYVNVKVESVIAGRSMSNQDYSSLKDLIERVNPRISVAKKQKNSPFASQ